MEKERHCKGCLLVFICIGTHRTYLNIGREERELQRPPILHAAGDHARQEQRCNAHLRWLVSATATATVVDGDLHVVGHRSDLTSSLTRVPEDDGDLWKWKAEEEETYVCGRMYWRKRRRKRW